MSFSFGWDELQKVETKLMKTRDSSKPPTFYPSHAAARGGIGVLVSSGTARAGVSRLPQAAKARRASNFNWLQNRSSSASSTRAPLREDSNTTSYYMGEGTAKAPSSVSDSEQLAVAANGVWGGGKGVPDVAKRDWEKGAGHAYPFCAAGRRVTTDDLRPGSKWATISYFETSVHEVKRHMEMLARAEREHRDFLDSNLDDDKTRHQAWATQQREIFNRQRAETAARYERSGIARGRGGLSTGGVFASTTLRPTTAHAAPQFAAWSKAKENMSSSGWSLPSTPRKKNPLHTKVYQRMLAESIEGMESSEERIRLKNEEIKKQKEEEEIRLSLAQLEKFEQQTLREASRKQSMMGGMAASGGGGHGDY